MVPDTSREADSYSEGSGGTYPFVAQYVAQRTSASFLRKQETPVFRGFLEADARTRTGDPFITSEVLYQLSYVGRRNSV